MSIHGDQSSIRSSAVASRTSQPAFDVWQTSTPPPSTWRHTAGAPPNVIANPQFSAQQQHAVPVRPDRGLGRRGTRSRRAHDRVARRLHDLRRRRPMGREHQRDQRPRTTPEQRGTGTPPAASRSPTATARSPPWCTSASGFRSHNLACSAAMTYTYAWDYPQGRRFKPGVDLYCGGASASRPLDCPAGVEMGQLNQLYHYARTHNVTHVVLAVGANDFNFSGVVKECMKMYEEQHLVDMRRALLQLRRLPDTRSRPRTGRGSRTTSTGHSRP